MIPCGKCLNCINRQPQLCMKIQTPHSKTKAKQQQRPLDKSHNSPRKPINGF